MGNGNSTDMSGNLTDIGNESKIICAEELPTSEHFLYSIRHSPIGLTLLVVYSILTIFTWAVYLDEIVFLRRTFGPNIDRRSTTILILGLFPIQKLFRVFKIDPHRILTKKIVANLNMQGHRGGKQAFVKTLIFSVACSTAGLAGYLVPRSSCLCDLVANVYLALVLYSLLLLMVNYLGGAERIGAVVRHYGGLTVHLTTVPFCCCCRCLPSFPLSGKTFMMMRALVLQVCIVRPMLNFIIAVFWSNGWYTHGEMDMRGTGFYFSMINLVTTLVAVWGINICKVTFGDILAQFKIGPKLGVVILVLLTTVFGPIIMGILTKAGVIHCTTYTTTRGAADAIYRGVVIVVMSVLSILARILYRREEDAEQLKELQETINDGQSLKGNFVVAPVAPEYAFAKDQAQAGAPIWKRTNDHNKNEKVDLGV